MKNDAVFPYGLPWNGDEITLTINVGISGKMIKGEYGVDYSGNVSLGLQGASDKKSFSWVIAKGEGIDINLAILVIAIRETIFYSCPLGEIFSGKAARRLLSISTSEETIQSLMIAAISGAVIALAKNEQDLVSIGDHVIIDENEGVATIKCAPDHAERVKIFIESKD